MFIKKSLTVLSLLGMISAPAAYAIAKGEMPPAPGATLAIPNLKSGVEVNLGILFLKPGASNLNYVIYNKELPTQSPTWEERELQPGFAPAFELGARYIFANSAGEDIKFAWTHLNSSTSDSVAAPSSSYFLGPDYEIGPDALVIRNAYGNVKFRYDVINLDVGQFLSFGEHLQLRFFGGLSTAFLHETVTATYSGTRTTTFPGPFSTTQQVNSFFTGTGPRVGLHADYTMRSGFGFVGEAAVSGLIGSMRSRTNYTSSAQELLDLYGQTINSQTISDQHVYQVVPGFDAKLGVNYQHAFAKDTIFTVTAGYQAAVYVNAISQYIPGSVVEDEGIETGGIFVGTMSHTLSNYSVQGPFLNFALKF